MRLTFAVKIKLWCILAI